jgi:hypothetical protein
MTRVISCSHPVLFYPCASPHWEAAMSIEEARYTVLEKQGDFEIRQYEAHVVAQTTVAADFDQAGSIAFHRLYDYISGHNRRQESIAMTAPINQQAGGETTAMTASVSRQQAEESWVLAFTMPAHYTAQTLPQPLDPTVVLREVPARKIAAVRYSGTWSRRRYERNKARLEAFIRDQGLRVVGAAIFARYDPPFQLFLLRRNEVLIPVE